MRVRPRDKTQSNRNWSEVEIGSIQREHGRREREQTLWYMPLLTQLHAQASSESKRLRRLPRPQPWSRSLGEECSIALARQSS